MYRKLKTKLAFFHSYLSKKIELKKSLRITTQIGIISN